MKTIDLDLGGAMRVTDMEGAAEISTESELVEFLMRRFSGKNEFWLSRQADSAPSLAIAVHGDLAYVSYFPGAGHPGFHSLGEVPNLDPSGSTKFVIGGEPEIEILNYSIVPFQDAMRAAIEFMNDMSMGQAIRWCEL